MKNKAPKEASYDKKSKVFWKVLDAALKLESTKGHLRWKMTDLSRGSGITRSLIYYYFGRSRLDIVTVAIRVIGEELFNLSPEREELIRSGRTLEAMKLTRELFRKAPHIGPFYLSQRRPNATFYGEISRLEKRYLDSLALAHPGASPDRLGVLFSALVGVVMLDNLPDSVLEELDRMNLGGRS